MNNDTMLTAQHSTAQHSTAQHSTAQHRRRMLLRNDESVEIWDYESYLTDSGNWYGKRCPSIVIDVKQGEKYYIEWSNVRTYGKVIYDMRSCGGMYLNFMDYTGRTATSEASGSIEITIPADGTLYVGVGYNASAKHGQIVNACSDADYYKVRKE